MDADRSGKPKRACRGDDLVIAPSGAALRPEVIAYAKTLLAGGLAGADAGRLADCLIDIALDKGEWLWPADR
jgi:hypothetical protein